MSNKHTNAHTHAQTHTLETVIRVQFDKGEVGVGKTELSGIWDMR